MDIFGNLIKQLQIWKCTSLEICAHVLDKLSSNVTYSMNPPLTSMVVSIRDWNH